MPSGVTEEILRYADVFRKKSFRLQLFVAPDPVLFAYIFADQPVEPLQLRFGEQGRPS